MFKFLLCFLLISIAYGCKKSDNAIPLKPLPTISWSISPNDPQRGDTAWYNGTKTINYVTSNATSVLINGIPITGTSGSFQTSLLTSATSFTATVSGPGGTQVSTLTVPVYSEKTTNLCKEKYWENIYIRAYGLDNPSNYLEPPLVTGKHYYEPNGTGKVIIPNGAGAGTYPMSSRWYFVDNETKMYKGPDNTWVIDSLLPNRHVEHKDNIGLDGKTYRTLFIWQSY